MRNTLIILIISLLVVVTGIFVFAKIFFSTPASVPVTTFNSTSQTQQGSSNVTDIVVKPISPANTFSVRSISGGEIKVKDFEKLSATIPDKNNGGHYYLAGFFSSINPNPPYTITYSELDQSFTIALWKKPLGQTRAAAEQFLQSTLGITKVQVCNLTYYISVPYDVDSSYGSANLGFSFCPGAKVLPMQ